LGLLIFSVAAEKKTSWTECIRNSSKKEKRQELKGSYRYSNKCYLQSKPSTASAQHSGSTMRLVGDVIHGTGNTEAYCMNT